VQPPKKTRTRLAELRGPLRIAGPIVTLIGIGLIVFSAVGFASTMGTDQSKIRITTNRTLRSPEHGWSRWAGMVLIAVGVVMTSMGFEIFAPKPKNDAQESGPRRKTVGEPLGQLRKPKSKRE
jgi:hypothetical protein